MREARGEEQASPAPALDLSTIVTTGIPDLDAILGGGLPRGGLALILGAPGTGKTSVAQQIGFNRAAQGEPVLYLTGFSEPHDKMVQLGRAMRFFDPRLVGTAIHFGSLPDLLRGGPEAAEAAVLATARQLRARLVVIDGLRGLGPLIGPTENQAAARFLYTLGTKLGLLGATTLVLAEGDPRNESFAPELAVVDVLVTLQLETRYGRDRRLLHVRKRRGGRPLPGLHPFMIDEDGIHVWPRFESLVQPSEAPWSTRRAAFRTPPIDELLHGGLTEGTVTLAAGSFGAGKTLLGLHFAAEGARLGEPTLVLGCMESAAQLREKGRVFDLQIEQYEQTGLLRIATFSGHDLEADRLAAEIYRDVERRGVRRLVIDSAAQLERSIVDEERRAPFFAALVTFLRGRGITTYMTYEITRLGAELDLTHTPLAVLAENVLVLRSVEEDGQLRRLLSVMHMRFSEHDHREHGYRIEAGRGMVLEEQAPVAAAEQRHRRAGWRHARSSGQEG